MLRDQIPRPRDLLWNPDRSRVLVIEQAHATVPVVSVEHIDRSDAQNRRECIDAKARFLARLSHRSFDGRLAALDASAGQIPTQWHPGICRASQEQQYAAVWIFNDYGYAASPHVPKLTLDE